jgi:lipid-binding SYLF domain-containing protein
MNRQISVRTLFLIVLCGLFLLTTAGFSADKDKDQSDIEKRIDNAAKVLDEIMATPDKGVPDRIMNDAKCIAIIPSMVKVAVGFGGSHGKGIATCRLDNGSGAELRRSPSPAVAGVFNSADRRSTSSWSS